MWATGRSVALRHVRIGSVGPGCAASASTSARSLFGLASTRTSWRSRSHSSPCAVSLARGAYSPQNLLRRMASSAAGNDGSADPSSLEKGKESGPGNMEDKENKESNEQVTDNSINGADCNNVISDLEGTSTNPSREDLTSRALGDDLSVDELELSLIYQRTKRQVKRRDRVVGGSSAQPPPGVAMTLENRRDSSYFGSGKEPQSVHPSGTGGRAIGVGQTASHPLFGQNDAVFSDAARGGDERGNTGNGGVAGTGTGNGTRAGEGDEEGTQIHMRAERRVEPRRLVRSSSFDLPRSHRVTVGSTASAGESGGVGNSNDSGDDADRFRLVCTFPEVTNLQIMPDTDETEQAKQDRITGYRVFRAMAPYIAVHRDSVMVIHVPGEVLLSHMADSVMHDIILLKTLGVKPVLVAGCRPQIRKRLADFGVKSFFVHGNRVCDYETLQHCQSVAGHVRVEIESLLGRGVVNSPTDMGNVAVASGNFVRAIPFGVRSGIDFKYTGTVQKVHARNIMALLDQSYVVLLGHLGYSPSGEIFHCRSEEVAVKAAIQLRASKLVLLHNGESLVDYTKKSGPVVHNLTIGVAKKFVQRLKAQLGEEGNRINHSDVDPMQQWELQFLDYMQAAITACEHGVQRIHLVSRRLEGSIVTELCTRDGTGIMISRDIYEGVRPAELGDVPSILNLIRPLEERGILVTRPPDQIESEIGRFIVYERDGEVLACCQMRSYEDARYGKGAVEMSCVAVSPQLRNEGIGNALLSYCSRNCVLQGYHVLFVLSTRSQHWFLDRGFELMPPESLPPKKYATYNQRRKPKVYFKSIANEREIDEEDLKWFTKLSLEDHKNEKLL